MKRQIMLIEDNPSDIELARRALQINAIDIDLLVMLDGQEALDYLLGQGKHVGRPCEDPPAVILLDLNLPRVSGLTVLQRLRSNPQTRRIPVVILSTSTETSDKRMSYDLGANSYICKPVDFREFSSSLARVAEYWLYLNELTD